MISLSYQPSEAKEKKTEFNIAETSNTSFTYKKVVSTLIYQEVYVFYVTHTRLPICTRVCEAFRRFRVYVCVRLGVCVFGH